MNYLQFLAQWYNWPFLMGIALAAATLLRPAAFASLGARLGRHLGLERVPGNSVLMVFGLTLGLVGLTLNAALHDYWPAAQKAGFAPNLIVSLVLALWVVRWVGRVRERHFPEIKSVKFGTPELSGQEGRIVSRMVGTDYQAGRAQVMGDDGTLHVVLCKTRSGEIDYAASVVLLDYDSGDGRYYVALADESSGPAGMTGEQLESRRRQDQTGLDGQ